MYKCNKCNKDFEKKQSYAAHRSHCSETTKRKYGAWNKGLTVETDIRVKRNTDAVKQAYNTGKAKIWCDGLTKDNDDRLLKLSKKVQSTVMNKVKNGIWHNSFSRARTHEYNGMKFYGKWELGYAKWLDENSIKWRQVKERFYYEYEEKEHYYTPDFYLIDDRQYIEVKGYPTEKDYAKWKWFPKDLKLKQLFGKDLKEMGIIDNYREV